MYNVLLTDDEQIVIDSLSFIISKNFPDEINIFKANSGSEAIYCSRTTKIDIIFIDINMPGLNGLESIKEIKKFNSECVIIVLTAFDRFNYAQEALNMGVFKYLTKPVNRNIVTQTLKDAMEIVDTNKKKYDSDIAIKEKLSLVSSIVESDFIYSSIYSSPDSKDLKKYFDYFLFDPKAYFFLCIELSGDSGELKENLYSIVRNVLSMNTKSIIGPLMSNRIIVFVPLEAASDTYTEDNHQNELCNKIYNILVQKIGFNLKIGVGSIYTELNKTSEAYKSALKALEVNGDNKGLHFSETSVKKDNNSVMYEQKILSRITSGDNVSIAGFVDSWINYLFESESDLNIIKNITFRVLVNARAVVSSNQNDYANNPLFNNTFQEISLCKNKDDFINYLTPLFVDCSCTVIQNRNNSLSPVIIKAKEYINSNLSKDISLEDMALYLNVTSFYLSKLFKSETGENFIDFLTDKRLGKAKELLKQGSLSIKEVSFECGYSDQNYFSKIFKRKFGLTPTEYKDSI